MKLNKTFGRIATTLVATAMLASVAAPVYAEAMNGGKIDNTNDTALSGITFDKYLVKPTGVPTPDVDFTFTLEGASVSGETIVDNGKTYTISSGVGHAGKKDDEAYTISDAAEFDTDSVVVVTDSEKNTTTVKESVTLDFTGVDFEFTQPGVYKYTLKEESSDSSNTDYKVDGNYVIYLYVERVKVGEEPNQTEQLLVTGAEMYKGNDRNGNKQSIVTNYYQVDPDTGETTSHNLTVEKDVTGTMGDKSKPFSFDISIDGNSTRPYAVEKFNASGVSQGTVTLNWVDNSWNGEFMLADGDYIVVKGLSANDQYTVTEDSYESEGYTTAVDSQANTRTKTDTLGDTDKTMTFTNNRAAVSPTGLVMDIAPYVLLVVVAAAGCFVFLRKRRED